MKRITTLQLALSFVGVFLGAGFVSGQELWQFFACFGPAGLLGFLLSAGLFLLVDLALLQLSRKTGITSIGSLVLPGDHPILYRIIDFLQCLLLLGVLVIMIAGAASLLHDLTGLSTVFCGLLFTLILLPVALLDLQGLVASFSVLVPITCTAAVIMGVTILIRQDFRFAPATGSVSALMPNWWISGVTYAAYNLFGTIAVLVPFASLVPDQKTIRRGLGLGTLFLLVLTFCILASLIAIPEAGSTELPTATLAAQLHPLLGIVYNLLMGLGMFAAALSSIIAFLNQGGLHWNSLQTHRRKWLLIVCLAAWLLSLAGFGNLIGIIYPIFGYISIPLLAMLVRNWLKSLR